MKKKIKYGNIPKDVLKMILGNCYSTGPYTLKDELDKYGEDIIYSQWGVMNYKDKSNKHLSIFRAWTKTYALMIVNDLMDDRIILGIERELPKEYREKECKCKK